MAHSNETKLEAIRLRKEERQSLKAISKTLDVPTATLSGWLKEFPIELSEQQNNRVKALRDSKIKQRLPESEISKTVSRQLTKAEKGLVAETAIKLQLILNGFEIFTPYHGTSKIDLICLTPKKNLRKIQIKWAKNQAKEVGNGLPYVSLTHYIGAEETGKYTKEECDFFIGYDFFTDSIYVFSFDETEGKDSIAISRDAKDAWHKIQ